MIDRIASESGYKIRIAVEQTSFYQSDGVERERVTRRGRARELPGFFFDLLLVLGIEPRALSMLRTCSTSQLYPKAPTWAPDGFSEPEMISGFHQILQFLPKFCLLKLD
jgi:hypothetical protein